jgi:hypothetical protein
MPKSSRASTVPLLTCIICEWPDVSHFARATEDSQQALLVLPYVTTKTRLGMLANVYGLHELLGHRRMNA